jgi:hypothetical protein
MNLRSQARRVGWLPLAALAAAAALELYDGGRAALMNPGRFTYNVGDVVDGIFATARGQLAPGERVGLRVPGQSESGDRVRWFSAQYALAPAIVVPVRYSACAKSVDDPGCGLLKLDRVLVPGAGPDAAARLASQFGRVVRMAGTVAILERPRP